MIRTALLVLVTMLIISGAFAGPMQDPPSEGDPQAGKELALKLCSSCHVVSPDQASAPALQPPALAFQFIANRRDLGSQSLRDFLAKTHSNIRSPLGMPNLNLTDEQAADVASYILALRHHR